MASLLPERIGSVRHFLHRQGLVTATIGGMRAVIASFDGVGVNQ
jgi:hypothetical protein